VAQRGNTHHEHLVERRTTEGSQRLMICTSRRSARTARTYGTPTWICSVAVDDALYVRAHNGQNSRWYRAALCQKAGRITAAGKTTEVESGPSACVCHAVRAVGATATTAMTHIPIQETLDHKVEWMEKLTASSRKWSGSLEKLRTPRRRKLSRG
jgi:hypothetical protein